MTAPPLEPGRLIKIGVDDADDALVAAINPVLMEDRYLGCTVNVGALNLLNAATLTAKVEGVSTHRPPSLEQLAVYDFPGRGRHWFYLPHRVARMLHALAHRGSRTSRWCTTSLGCDGRSQVAVLRMMGIHVLTTNLEAKPLAGGIDAPLVEYTLIGEAATGLAALTLAKKGDAHPYSEILPTPEVARRYRDGQILDALQRRVAAAARDQQWLEEHDRLTAPVVPDQLSLDL